MGIWCECTYCSSAKVAFLIKFSDNGESVSKAGQFPPFDIAVGRNTKKLLGQHEEMYRKGLTCERFGYGIGAYAYYRRIIERILDRLLTNISEILEDEDKIKYSQALERTRNTIVALEKIDLVKDLLPPILRPDGINPLSVLHEALSKGIHSDDDDKCLEYAQAIRESITFLVDQVENQRNISRTFTENMRKLLEKKSQKP